MFDEIMLMTTLMQNVVALVLHPFLSCMLKDSIEALMDYVVPFHSLGGHNVRLLKHFGNGTIWIWRFKWTEPAISALSLKYVFLYVIGTTK